ncbi:MAG: alpha-1,2-fucosyltransferase [Candidatus Saccharimonadia bacterium]
MFQYAAGKRLAEKNQTELKLDLTWYDDQHPGDTPRVYELDSFSFELVKARQSEIPQPSTSRLGWLKDKAGGRKSLLTTITEEGFAVNPNVLVAPDNSYLVGYWQSEKYFSDYHDTITSDFRVKSPLSGQNLEMASAIGGVTSVSLHVRRGDYVTNANANQFHGTSPLDYYYAAIAALTKKVSSPSFFVFSDDPDWCKDNLKLDYPTTYVEHNAPDKGYEDMRLMSSCQHHIIANSSFSWWGAWLNPKSDKLVYAPKQWFKDPAVDTTDLIPSGWIKV